jgi:hypothetical protein
MNSKSILVFSLFVAVALAASPVNAAPRGGSHSSSMPMGREHTFTRGGTGTWSGGNWSGHRWSGGNWSGRNWNNWGGNWRHHHHHNNDVIFIGDFGFPWWWGWGWGWGYPYGYYGYPYGYGYGYPYYGYGYGGYGYDYGQPGYGPYGGYGYGNYGNSSRSRVSELQRRLARAGYYHGSIDGIMGPATRRAIRAYERDHGYAS